MVRIARGSFNRLFWKALRNRLSQHLIEVTHGSPRVRINETYYSFQIADEGVGTRGTLSLGEMPNPFRDHMAAAMQGEFEDICRVVNGKLLFDLDPRTIEIRLLHQERI